MAVKYETDWTGSWKSGLRVRRSLASLVSHPITPHNNSSGSQIVSEQGERERETSSGDPNPSWKWNRSREEGRRGLENGLKATLSQRNYTKEGRKEGTRDVQWNKRATAL